MSENSKQFEATVHATKDCEFFGLASVNLLSRLEQ